MPILDLRADPRRAAALFVATILIAAVAACGSGDAMPDDPNALAVTAVVPANNASGVLLNTTVDATFSEAVDPATVTGTAMTVSSPAGPVGGTISVSADGQVVTFVPAAPLATGTTYTARIRSQSVRSITGKSLSVDFVWNWSTGAGDSTAPTVVSTVPADFATGVCRGQQIRAVFGEAMDPQSITSATFILVESSLGATPTPIPAVVAFAAATRTATLTPATDLQGPGNNYTATIRGGASGVRDLAGNALAVDRVWNFSTGAACPGT